MEIRELQDQIRKKKKEEDWCILAHTYQSQEILEVADIVGDSYALSVKAKSLPQEKMIVCGVRFMAETCKILSPDKTVYLANPEAGCPMADQMTKEEGLDLKKKYPGAPLVAYINTTAELKTVADVVVTSSSAVKIVKNLKEKEIIFVPDPNLGAWVARKVPEKTFHFFEGGCPVHGTIRVEDLKQARKAHPKALIFVHPEVSPDVSALADYVGSTSEIMDEAIKSSAKEIIIGTENSIVDHLHYLAPEKAFYPLSLKCICFDMQTTHLMDINRVLEGRGGEEILLDPQVMDQARRSIDRMMELG